MDGIWIMDILMMKHIEKYRIDLIILSKLCLTDKQNHTQKSGILFGLLKMNI